MSKLSENADSRQITIGDQISARKNRRASFRLEAEVREAARNLNLSAGQTEDLVLRAKQQFVIQDGEFRAMRIGQNEPLRSESGRLLSVAEWALQIKGRPIPAGACDLPTSAWTGKNPYRRLNWNLTEQMRRQTTDPVLAARLKQEA